MGWLYLRPFNSVQDGYKDGGHVFYASYVLNPSSIYSDNLSPCVVFVFTYKIEGKGEISSITGQLELVIRLKMVLSGACL